jgi:hypothetical protein
MPLKLAVPDLISNSYFPALASVGEKLFPPQEACLIAELIRRDLPYYDATISEELSPA